MLISLAFASVSQAVEQHTDKIPIRIEKTRIYLDDAKRHDFFSFKNEGSIPLAYSATVIRPNEQFDDGGQSTVALVSPPNGVVAAQNSQTLRVVLLDRRLPKDRETFAYLRLKFLPATDSNPSGVSINSTLTLYAKLFVRPASLVDYFGIQKACRRVTADKTAEGIRLLNPTPYWLTFPAVRLDGQTMPRGERAPMVAPFGELDFARRAKTVDFSCVMETGFPTDPQVVLIP